MDKQDIKILFLDDEKDIVETLQKLFAMKGYQTFMALNADEALKVFTAEKPHICVFDIFLVDSHLNGIEVLTEIRRSGSEALAIFFSRVTDDAILKQANELGIFDFLVKPFTPSDLNKVIEAAAETVKDKADNGQ